MQKAIVAVDGTVEFVDLTPDEIAFMQSITVPTVIPDISRRQFFQQLAAQAVITQDEAFAALGGTIPPELLTLINALPSDQQFAAKMLLAGATTFQRQHSLTLAIGAAYGWTPEQIDTFFAAGALL